MNPRKSIRDGLSLAAGALVGASATSTTRAVELDASILYYSEGSRVTVNELVVALRAPLGGDRVFNLGATLDVMTGASANGALPANRVQTFTRPSGRGVYVVLPGQTPMDDTFQDNRVAAEASLETPLGRRGKGVLGAHYSIEYDYFSAGTNATLTRDFDRRNTTVALGGAFSYDGLSPEGGIPAPFASMGPGGAEPARARRVDDKLVFDLLLGVTQVINRSTLARFNYTLSHSSGYHTDPFKLVSAVDSLGDPADYVYENRPDARTRHSVYTVVKHHRFGDVIDVSYRYMRDDWGVRSHTVEARYRRPVGARGYLQPQWRFYRQSAVDFFTAYLAEGDPIPDYASADYRLGAFDAHTIALKYGVLVDDAREINVRLGYYRQTGPRSPPDAFGSLLEHDLFPDVGAYVLQVGYSMILE